MKHQYSRATGFTLLEITVVVAVLAILAAVFVIQNLPVVPFNILFIEIKMPGLIFYGLLLGIGFLLGYSFAKRER